MPVLPHQRLDVRPDRVGALGEDPVPLVEHLVEDLHALVGQPDLVGVGVHQRPADGLALERASQSLTVEFSSPPTYWIGLLTRAAAAAPGAGTATREQARVHGRAWRDLSDVRGTEAYVARVVRTVSSERARPEVGSAGPSPRPGRARGAGAGVGPQPPRRPRCSSPSRAFGAVLAAVHHAEVVAHRVGEPFGSLVLAVAVTVIEVALILTLMLCRWRRHRDAGPGHRLRRRDDHLQRHRRSDSPAGRAAAPPGALQPRGHRRRARDRDHAGRRDAGPAPLHHHRAGSGVHRRAAGLRRGRVARALRACSCSPRPSGTATSSCRSGDGDDADGDGHADPPTDRATLASPRPARRRARRGRRAGEGRVPADRGRGRRRGPPPGLRRCRDRPAGAAPRVDRRGRGRPGATRCRSASTSPTGRRSPASA